MSPPIIKVIAATTKSEPEFFQATPLGRSLRRLNGEARITSQITFRNTGAAKRGLSCLYNRAITGADSDSILVFTHDDVWLDDCFLAQRLDEALQQFAVVGVAGNRRITDRQPGWAFVDEELNWDALENLSGAVAHGADAGGPISHYGPTPAACELLDGVFLAAKAAVLAESGLRFNERLEFHFYDLDFCREARARGLRVGTWPIALTHRSGGAFGNAEWLAARQVYFEKWKT